MVRVRQPMYGLVSTLIYGLPLFALAQTPPTQSKAAENYQKFAEQCIEETEQKLKAAGVVPSEESADYDTKFDDFYKDCMNAKGLPDTPLQGDEEGPPEPVTE